MLTQCPGKAALSIWPAELRTQRWEFDPLQGFTTVAVLFPGPSRHQSPNRLLNWTGSAALARPALSSATLNIAPATTRARRVPPINCDSCISAPSCRRFQDPPRRREKTPTLTRMLAVRRASCCSHVMTFIDHPKGRAYYRHWAGAEPRAAVIFLHGFGEHTGVYHRYGFALNAAGIDLWAVDQFGHGLSPGDRGDFGSIEDSSALADTLTEVAERERPGLPLIAQGHSFGSVVTLFRLLAQPERYRAGVVSGAPLVPIPEMLDADSSFDLDPGWLSGDPFYLDSLENDPLAFVDADGLPLARELDKAWDRFGADLPKLTVPTLAVHGVNDPIAPIDPVRAYAEQIGPLQLKEFPGAHHDILNETVHREVAAAVIDFVEKQAGL